MLNERLVAAAVTLKTYSRGDSSLLPVTAVQPKLVLVESDQIRSVDSVFNLLNKHYCVTVVKDVRELFLVQDGEPFHLALLSDDLGSLALVAAAQSVRRQWPEARILVLGQAAVKLEDNLYDDAIGHSCKQEDLLEALTKLGSDPWRQRAEGHPFIVQPLKREQTVERAGQHQSLEALDQIKVVPAGVVRQQPVSE
jgi:hypothetical protein